jgi:nucleoside-diphosphate-sugar epimerase
LGKVIALTGAAGYLGGVLLSQLRQQPWVERIVAVDLKPIPADGRVVSYCLDVREGSFLRAIMAEHGVTHVIHAAFIATQPPEMPLGQMQSNNIEGSRQVLRSAMSQNVQQFVFVSSVAVYGYRGGHPARIHEGVALRPNMIYGQHQVEVERFLRDQQEYFRSRIAIIRPTAIIGPCGKTVPHPLKALTNQPFFLVSDRGRALTQALHEQDAVSLIVKILERNVSGTFNAGPNDYASWADIARLANLPIVSIPRQVLNFAVRFSPLVPAMHGFSHEVVNLLSESLVADNTAARKQTGWQPRYSTCDAFAQFF